MSIYDVRRSNVLRLTGTERGYVSHFARRMGMSQQQASHVIGATIVKNIGDDMARRIEQVYGLPIGSLDHEPRSEALPDGIQARLLTDVAGMPYLTDDGFASCMILHPDWVRVNMAIAPEHVAILPMRGDTMAPTIMDGDLCLVDRGATDASATGVYALARDTELHVLRVRRSPAGGVALSCDNGAYPPLDVPSLREAGLTVLGRVLMTLRPSRI